MENRPSGRRTTLFDSSQLDSVLENMALHMEGFLKGKSKVMLVGVLRRGAPLADRLMQKLVTHHNQINISRMDLRIKRYADDLQLIHPETKLTENPEHTQIDLSGTTVLVVDDVLYQGYSMLRAVEYLAGKHADEIRTVVLVDRGVSKLPVHSDVTGVRLEVAAGDIIECNVPPYEDEFRIDVLQPGR